jgi:hypothetical protein
VGAGRCELFICDRRREDFLFSSAFLFVLERARAGKQRESQLVKTVDTYPIPAVFSSVIDSRHSECSYKQSSVRFAC